MFLPEFLEALCRAVDKASPIPLGDSREDWPMEKRQAQPLVKKLENILPSLIKLITHPDLKILREKFPMPPKDLVTGLYTPNYESPFYKDYIIKPRPIIANKKTKKEKIVAIDKKENEEGEEGKENEENKENENEEEKKEGEENDEINDNKENDNENNEENNLEGDNIENEKLKEGNDENEGNEENEGIANIETAGETYPNENIKETEE